jgi:hypothetical protein
MELDEIGFPLIAVWLQAAQLNIIALVSAAISARFIGI